MIKLIKIFMIWHLYQVGTFPQVSATPGKTKHYQTHVLEGGTATLADGPGLVIPDLSMSKADMVLGGILPIDNLTDFGPSVDLLVTKVIMK